MKYFYVVFIVMLSATAALPHHIRPIAKNNVVALEEAAANIQAGDIEGLMSESYAQETTVTPTLSLTIHFFIEGLVRPECNCTIGDTATVIIAYRLPWDEVSWNTYTVTFDEAGYIDTKIPVLLDRYFYIGIQHRNSIRTWSSDSMMCSSLHSWLDYDFTSAQNKAYGNNMVGKSANGSPTVYCFYSGDVNQDGAIDPLDISLIDQDVFNYASGYVVTDLNGDGYVDPIDESICEQNSFNYVTELCPIPE